MRLCACTGWCESAYFTQVWRYFFAWWSSYDVQSLMIRWQNIIYCKNLVERKGMIYVVLAFQMVFCIAMVTLNLIKFYVVFVLLGIQSQIWRGWRFQEASLQCCCTTSELRERSHEGLETYLWCIKDRYTEVQIIGHFQNKIMLPYLP